MRLRSRVDYSSAGITARLRTLASASALGGRPWAAVDMSAEAVTERIAELSDLSALCATLAALGETARE